MSINIRTKVINDTNELIFKNKDILIDNSNSSSEEDNDTVTVTIIQPTNTKYTIQVYLMEYRTSDEEDMFEADTSEAHSTTFTASKNSIYFVVLLDNSTNSISNDYYLLNVASRGKLTRDITIKFNE